MASHSGHRSACLGFGTSQGSCGEEIQRPEAVLAEQEAADLLRRSLAVMATSGFSRLLCLCARRMTFENDP